MATKICNACKIRKDIAEFNRDKTSPDGYAYTCRACKKRKAKDLALRKQAGGKRYLLSGQIPEPTISYFTQNCVICEQNFYPHTPAVTRCSTCAKLTMRIFHSLNCGKDYADRQTPIEWVVEITKQFFNARSCVHCAGNFTEENPKSIDHILPVCMGGDGNLSNIAISCLDCNRSKARLSLNAWIDLCKRVCENYKVKLDL